MKWLSGQAMVASAAKSVAAQGSFLGGRPNPGGFLHLNHLSRRRCQIGTAPPRKEDTERLNTTILAVWCGGGAASGPRLSGPLCMQTLFRFLTMYALHHSEDRYWPTIAQLPLAAQHIGSRRLGVQTTF